MAPPSPELTARGNEIVAEVAPLPGDVVIHKGASSAFLGTPLTMLLRDLGVDTVVCCGETTSGCVRATVVDASSLRFHVAVVAECCFDRTQMSHHVSLFDMDQKYADVVSLAGMA